MEHRNCGKPKNRVDLSSTCPISEFAPPEYETDYES